MRLLSSCVHTSPALFYSFMSFLVATKCHHSVIMARKLQGKHGQLIMKWLISSTYWVINQVNFVSKSLLKTWSVLSSYCITEAVSACVLIQQEKICLPGKDDPLTIYHLVLLHNNNTKKNHHNLVVGAGSGIKMGYGKLFGQRFKKLQSHVLNS